MSTGGHSYEPVGMHSVDQGGGLTLRLPQDFAPAVEAARAPHGGLASLVEFTDIAPAAVRDRVRSRVTLAGWLTPDDTAADPADLLPHLDLAYVTLRTVAGPADVSRQEFAPADPDPLAAREVHLLTHLTDDHQEVVAALTRLIEPRSLHGVARVWPLRLDRYGLTLDGRLFAVDQPVRLLLGARNSRPWALCFPL